MENLSLALNILLDMEQVNQDLIKYLVEEDNQDLDMDYAMDMNLSIQKVIDLISKEMG